jgi:hypothetical protein
MGIQYWLRDAQYDAQMSDDSGLVAVIGASSAACWQSIPVHWLNSPATSCHDSQQCRRSVCIFGWWALEHARVCGRAGAAANLAWTKLDYRIHAAAAKAVLLAI